MAGGLAGAGGEGPEILSHDVGTFRTEMMLPG